MAARSGKKTTKKAKAAASSKTKAKGSSASRSGSVSKKAGSKKAVGKKVAKKPASKKPAAKKAPSKKAASKAPAKKKISSRSAAKKTGTKKPAAKKAASKKPAAKKATSKKSASKKTASKKTASKKPVVKKAAAKKTTSKKTISKSKPASKKSVSKKPASKKTASKGSAKPKSPAATKASADAAKKAGQSKPGQSKPGSGPAAGNAADNSKKSGRKGITIVSKRPKRRAKSKAIRRSFTPPGERLLGPNAPARKPLIPSGPKAKVRTDESESGPAGDKKSPFNKRELNKYRKLLLAKRAELMGDVEQLETDALRSESGNLSNLPQHMADAGSDNYETSLSLDLAAADRRLIKEIDAALKRIDDRTYGLCEHTGRPINLARLDELPWARFSIEAARELERRGGF